MALRTRKVSGSFEKRVSGSERFNCQLIPLTRWSHHMHEGGWVTCRSVSQKTGTKRGNRRKDQLEVGGNSKLTPSIRPCSHIFHHRIKHWVLSWSMQLKVLLLSFFGLNSRLYADQKRRNCLFRVHYIYRLSKFTYEQLSFVANDRWTETLASVIMCINILASC